MYKICHKEWQLEKKKLEAQNESKNYQKFDIYIFPMLR